MVEFAKQESVTLEVKGSDTSVGIRSLDQKSSTVFCRICHCGGSNERLLIHPCFCKGSVGNVHLTCLERWLNQSGVDRCELCLFQFAAEHTRRYTIWRSMVIWAHHPSHRSLLYSDAVVMIVLTIVVTFLVTCLVMGLSTFKTTNPDRSAVIWGQCLIAVFITTSVLCYLVSMYTIIKDNFRPWFRWWRSCNDIRLTREQLPAVQQQSIEQPPSTPQRSVNVHNRDTPAAVHRARMSPPPQPLGTTQQVGGKNDDDDESVASSTIPDVVPQPPRLPRGPGLAIRQQLRRVPRSVHIPLVSLRPPMRTLPPVPPPPQRTRSPAASPDRARSRPVFHRETGRLRRTGT